DVEIKTTADSWVYVANLRARKDEVNRWIDHQGRMTDELKQAIIEATELHLVADSNRPYRDNRRTGRMTAKEKRLEPLATMVWEQEEQRSANLAEDYLSEEHELHTAEDVLAGVNDIIAEWISDEPEYREFIRNETFKRGTIESTVKDEQKDEKRV